MFHKFSEETMRRRGGDPSAREGVVALAAIESALKAERLFDGALLEPLAAFTNLLMSSQLPPDFGDYSLGDGLLAIDDFLRIDLRVALVTQAERIEGADKLLKLQLDLGGQTRQIVAGIAKAYLPEQLVGKRIVVVCNLKPATLRGVVSQGMLLAADLDGRPIIATFDEEVAPGTRVR